jgi:hypothetical protein
MDCKGQYISLTIRSQSTPAAAHRNIKLEKIISNKYRAGIQFKNLKSVKESIESSERDDVQPLRWGKWKTYPYVIEHKGKEYVRLYPSTNSDTGMEITYLVNGKQVNKTEFNTYLKPCDRLKQGTTPECFFVALENILEVKE